MGAVVGDVIGAFSVTRGRFSRCSALPRPYKSTDDGLIESFYARLHDECLNANEFTSSEYMR